jgi:hypothetical protein
VYRLSYIAFSILALLLFSLNLKSQQTGEPLPGLNPDTVYVFESPRPLINPVPPESRIKNLIGFSLNMSGSGYGAGFSYTRKINEIFSLFTSFYFSGARNSDELEYWDPYTGQTIIPGKVNRLYLLPLMFGGELQPFHDVFDDSFRPYLRLGVGPSFIFANDYSVEFFKAIGQTEIYTRFGSFLGLGANLMGQGKTTMGLDISYYYIPFGGNGLESMKDLPIYNFGGIVLSLNFSYKF